MKDPFLFRFMDDCVSPARVQSSDFAEYEYDENLDMVRWLGSTDKPPAIDVSGVGGPPTKKKDLEKGEDSKDRRMWQ